MKQYLSLCMLIASSLSGAVTTLYPKPAIVTSTVKSIKQSLNTPTGSIVQRSLPYALLFAYYVHCTDAKELLPIPGLATLKTHVIGGAPAKSKRFGVGYTDTVKTSKGVKTIREFYEDWKIANKDKTVGDFVKDFEKDNSDFKLILEDYSVPGSTFGDKATKEWKKFGVLATLFKWTLIGYITSNVGRDAKNAWDYLITEE